MTRDDVLDALLAQTQEQLDALHSLLRSLQESLTSEAKSTAGDKHETGRAMIHQEMRQANESVVRAQQTFQALSKLKQGRGVAERVVEGVLVETNGPWVLIGVALGRLVVNHEEVVGVSAEAPLAKQWNGSKVGDAVTMGPRSLIIRALH